MWKRNRNRGKKGRGSVAVVYDSDDERAYQREDVPDPTSSEFYNDTVDDFHSDRDKVLTTLRTTNIVTDISMV